MRFSSRVTRDCRCSRSSAPPPSADTAVFVGCDRGLRSWAQAGRDVPIARITNERSTDTRSELSLAVPFMLRIRMDSSA
jgi:hypothetical protein